MIQLCRHILPAGRECTQPALHGTHYCRFHTQARQHTRRRRRNPNDFTFTLPLALPEDRAAIQTNLHLIALATIEGRIEPAVARALTYTYRACALNLKAGPLLEADHDNTVQRVILTPDGEEIAPPREALEKDESAPTHGPECPCRKCAEQLSRRGTRAASCRLQVRTVQSERSAAGTEPEGSWRGKHCRCRATLQPRTRSAHGQRQRRRRRLAQRLRIHPPDLLGAAGRHESRTRTAALALGR